MRKKLIAFATIISFCAGILIPQASMARTLTVREQAAVGALGQSLVVISARVQSLLQQRDQEAVLFGQMSDQMRTMSTQLQQGGVTQSTMASMQATVSAIAAQVNAIAQRRARENAVLIQLPPLLQQLSAWIATNLQ